MIKSRKLDVQVPMKLATDSTAKREFVQAANKLALKALRGTTDPLTITLAAMQARQQSHHQTRNDLPLRGIDNVTLTTNTSTSMGKARK